jgi:hypothetical protein
LYNFASNAPIKTSFYKFGTIQMKISQILRNSFAALILGTLFSSCSNDVDVIGEWKEIPVVYAVFSPYPDSSGINYFRIEKAFLDPDTDALLIAQRPDSIYYGPNDLEVTIYERTVFTNYTVLDTLERVDFSTLGITRDSGIFARTPNYVYMMNNQVRLGSDDDQFYKLVIKNLVNGKVYTQYSRGITMGVFSPSDLTYTNFKFTLPTQSRPIRWSHVDPASNETVFDKVDFNWSQPSNAAIYDLTVILRYAEFQADLNTAGEPEIPGTRVYKEVSWKAIRNFAAPGDMRLTTPFQNSEKFYYFVKNDGGSVKQELNGENFYNFLASNLSDVVNTGSNIRRCAIKIDARIDAGGPEIAEYIRARNANQNLLGGLFPADPFSNIEEGYGIFSYKFHIYRRNYNIEDETFDYLNSGEITRNLGFKSFGCN